jgi:catechol 2,3-dioxygenase-like lactoylglutathione lyase family enzyme
MAQAIHPQRVNHMNVVLEDFDSSVGHFTGRYGAEFMADMPQKEFHACLIEMGQVIFELFVPWDFLVSARLGPHYVGLEWQADMDEVRAALTDQGLRTVRDIGVALHTHPADCFGVSHEFYAGEFHSRDWPLLGGTIHSAQHWRDEHPLGLTGLRGYTHGVADLDAASAFYRDFLAAEPVFDEARPAIGARARGLKVADAIIELLAPDSAGWLAQQLSRQGEGILSTVFGVRDMTETRHYLTRHGIPIGPGTAEDYLAVPAEANRGVMFEFSQHRH